MMRERRRTAEALFGHVDEEQLAAFIAVTHGVLGELERPAAE
jgi:hypothetical protein